MEGWIKINRKIAENLLWTDKPFSKGQAWIDLLIHARFKSERLLIKGKAVEIPRGSYLVSEEKLCQKWGWSRNKVRAYLKLLADEGMIEKKGTAFGTLLTIVKYEVYQGDGTTQGTTKGTTESTTQSTSKGTAQGTQNKKERKVKKEKKEEGKNNPPIPPYFPDDEKLDFAFADFVDFRRRMKVPLSDMDCEKVKRRLLELSMQDGIIDTDKAVEIINQSILNGWKGLFPLGRDKKPRASPQENEWDALRRKYEGVGD